MRSETESSIFALSWWPDVILENGVIRTMDPSLPVTRALAIAGDRIAGGVGTHETALASPERVDLGLAQAVAALPRRHPHRLVLLRDPREQVARLRVARHDLGDFPARAWLSAIHDSNGWSGRIIGPDTTTNLDEVVAVYYRRPSRFTFPLVLPACV